MRAARKPAADSSFCVVDYRPCRRFAHGVRDVLREEITMLQLAVALLLIALVAAVLGFGGIAGSFVGLAKIVFIVFLILAVLAFFGVGTRGRRFFG